MVYDMDVIRKIMIKLAEDDRIGNKMFKGIDGIDKDVVAYNCKVMYEAGFIDYYEYRNGGFLLVGDLTWEGGQLLESIKQDTVWKKIKENISSKSLPYTLDVLKCVSSSIVQEMLHNVLK